MNHFNFRRAFAALKSSTFALLALATICFLGCFAVPLQAKPQDEVIPRGQSKPPNRPYSPEEAIEKMTVPEGFTVEVVAAEPDVVNPVAMTFDEQGRIWIVESLEYPRRSPGVGRDRVKVLEDLDHDGKYETVHIFAEGLNIPCGIAVGHGGVWVSNSPDILFMQDTDGDLKADTTEVVVTGFGRDDTHELPNSLVWGPDGYLYGLNGVFNHSHVRQDEREYRFTCAMFRIDPRTHRFELFAEGTSNPWGIAWDPEGNAFLSACVIDHLWHLTESGYYHRQAGPYPPYTWKIESIVDHRHQQAAYCGIHYFDSDAYPEEFRDRLYMGNIHGNCINTDSLERRGSTYHASGHPDLLSANDAWFMPVSQKTGPDGCLYILDWYDRYHCYQDANRDPEGIDRLKGRLYRLRYQGTPRAEPFDMATETTAQLVERLHAANDYTRSTAQRVLSERGDDSSRLALQELVLDPNTPMKPMMHALFALIGRGGLDQEFHLQLLQSSNPRHRAWGVRAAGNQGEVSTSLQDLIVGLAGDDSDDVRLQVAIASVKIPSLPAVDLLVNVLQNSSDDILIPRIVWQNLHPLLETENARFVELLEGEAGDSSAVVKMIPRVVDRIIGVKDVSASVYARLFSQLAEGGEAERSAARQCLDVLRMRVQSGEISEQERYSLRDALRSNPLFATFEDDDRQMAQAAVFLACTWGDADAAAKSEQLLADASVDSATRLSALDALLTLPTPTLHETLRPLIQDRENSTLSFRSELINRLGRFDSTEVGTVVVEAFADMEAELKPKALELLTSRRDWSHALLVSIEGEYVSKDALNLNQVRKMLAFRDSALDSAVSRIWGTIRSERNPDREQVINRMRTFLRMADGDPHAGVAVFGKVCGQCHKIYGEGFDVGPDITVNGRGDFEQLLSNVFDPSLVIGADYQARTVLTIDGRIETGLLAEENANRVVLKPQGGKQIVIARDDIDEIAVSKLSLMPEDLEKQLSYKELADLFAFISLDKHPADEEARLIRGAREVTPAQSTNARDYAGLVGQIFPGFTTSRSGVDGVAVLANYRGRNAVLRTHPVSESEPCVLVSQFYVPEDNHPMLVLPVAHDDHDGDWILQVKINDELVSERVIDDESTEAGWTEVMISLQGYAGSEVKLELMNSASDWHYEYGYWGTPYLKLEGKASSGQ